MIVCYTVRNWSFCDGPFSKYEKASSRLDIHDTEQGEEKDKQVSGRLESEQRVQYAEYNKDNTLHTIYWMVKVE